MYSRCQDFAVKATGVWQEMLCLSQRQKVNDWRGRCSAHRYLDNYCGEGVLLRLKALVHWLLSSPLRNPQAMIFGHALKAVSEEQDGTNTRCLCCDDGIDHRWACDGHNAPSLCDKAHKTPVYHSCDLHSPTCCVEIFGVSCRTHEESIPWSFRWSHLGVEGTCTIMMDPVTTASIRQAHNSDGPLASTIRLSPKITASRSE